MAGSNSPDLKTCTRLTISLNNEVLAELDRKAEEMGCPRSVYITMALKQKWQTEENAKNLPLMLSTLGNAVRVIEEMKNDPELMAKAKADPMLLSDLADLPKK